MESPGRASSFLASSPLPRSDRRPPCPSSSRGRAVVLRVQHRQTTAVVLGNFGTTSFSLARTMTFSRSGVHHCPKAHLDGAPQPLCPLYPLRRVLPRSPHCIVVDFSAYCCGSWITLASTRTSRTAIIIVKWKSSRWHVDIIDRRPRLRQVPCREDRASSMMFVRHLPSVRQIV